MRKAIARLCDAEHGLMSATGRNVHSVLAARWFSARSTSLIIPMAVLAVAGIAGCGSVGTSGGAASLPPIAASGTASPAGRMHALPRRALSKLPKARHHVGLAPAVVDPVAFAHPELLTPIRDHEVHGSSVTAVGDSVMLGSEPALERRLPGIYVDAEVSRQFSVGLQAIAALASSGELRPIVVVGLGTNGTVTTDQIRQLMAEIGPGRRLVLVNTFEARPWEAEVNATLAAAARRYQNVVLANWYKTIKNRTYLLWGDGIHPQPAGTVVYARMVNGAVQLAGNLPS
jgi:hypothetical protein